MHVTIYLNAYISNLDLDDDVTNSPDLWKILLAKASKLVTKTVKWFDWFQTFEISEEICKDKCVYKLTGISNPDFGDTLDDFINVVDFCLIDKGHYEQFSEAQLKDDFIIGLAVVK